MKKRLSFAQLHDQFSRAFSIGLRCAECTIVHARAGYLCGFSLRVPPAPRRKKQRRSLGGKRSGKRLGRAGRGGQDGRGGRDRDRVHGLVERFDIEPYSDFSAK